MAVTSRMFQRRAADVATAFQAWDNGEIDGSEIVMFEAPLASSPNVFTFGEQSSGFGMSNVAPISVVSEEQAIGTANVVNPGSHVSGRVATQFAGASNIGAYIGGMAHGYVRMDAVDRVGYVRAAGQGSFAMGAVRGATTNSSIRCVSPGSVAMGYAKNSTMYCYGFGTMAFGYAEGAGSIYAGGKNTFQFGQGSNTLSYSLGVGIRGVGLRLCGAGAPGYPSNGDLWVANDYVYIRSDGADVKIT